MQDPAWYRKGSEELRAILHDDVEEAIAYQTHHTRPQLTQQAPIEAEVTHLPATLYDPSAQYIAMPSPRPVRTVQPHTVQPVVQEPARRKWPLTYAEIVARNEAHKQERAANSALPLSLPAPAVTQTENRTTHTVASSRLGTIQRIKDAYRRGIEIERADRARRRGLPIPTSAIEEPEVTPVPTANPVKLKAPEPIMQSSQPAIEPLSFTGYLLDSEYRNF